MIKITFEVGENYIKTTGNAAKKNVDALLEQEPADKVEPKFKVGDWVVYVCGEESTTLQISRIIEGTYEFTDGSSLNVVDEDTLHLWTIEDAKDGDVLCCESGWACIFKSLGDSETFSSYCFMDNTGWFCETGSESHTLEKAFIKAYNGNIYPATKAQRDTLMKAMADAGYTFDFEKKELKELAHQETSEWSEEDEHMRIGILEALSAYADHMQYTGFCASAELIRGELMSWLKSLKDRVQLHNK